MTHKNLKTHNLDSMSHFIDRLIVENIKLYDFQRRIEVEYDKGADRDDKAIASLYQSTINANEARAMAKNKIDFTLAEALKCGSYSVITETRTFSVPTDPPHGAKPRMGEHSGTEFQPEFVKDTLATD
jgi:hypothetical protein